MEETTEIERTSRRSVLRGAGLAAGAIAFQSVLTTASEVAASGHSDHSNHANHGTGHAAGAKSQPNAELVDAARACTRAGEACRAHCLQRIADGDASLGACLASVEEMLDACRMLERFATTSSDHLAAVARLCADVCDDCEEACRKHAEHHDTCRACAEACADCAKACRS